MVGMRVTITMGMVMERMGDFGDGVWISSGLRAFDLAFGVWSQTLLDACVCASQDCIRTIVSRFRVCLCR